MDAVNTDSLAVVRMDAGKASLMFLLIFTPFADEPVNLDELQRSIPKFCQLVTSSKQPNATSVETSSNILGQFDNLFCHVSTDLWIRQGGIIIQELKGFYLNRSCKAEFNLWPNLQGPRKWCWNPRAQLYLWSVKLIFVCKCWLFPTRMQCFCLNTKQSPSILKRTFWLFKDVFPMAFAHFGDQRIQSGFGNFDSMTNTLTKR